MSVHGTHVIRFISESQAQLVMERGEGAVRCRGRDFQCRAPRTIFHRRKALQAPSRVQRYDSWSTAWYSWHERAYFITYHIISTEIFFANGFYASKSHSLAVSFFHFHHMTVAVQAGWFGSVECSILCLQQLHFTHHFAILDTWTGHQRKVSSLSYIVLCLPCIFLWMWVLGDVCLAQDAWRWRFRGVCLPLSFLRRLAETLALPEPRNLGRGVPGVETKNERRTPNPELHKKR